MSSLITVFSTALIPFTAVFTLSIYLSTHPDSPAKSLLPGKRVKLPVHRDEGLDGSTDNDGPDPFDLHDPVVMDDGTPVNPEKFWSAAWRKKLAFLILLIPPFACNIALLVFTVLSDLKGEERTRATLIPSLLLPSHLITVLFALWYLRHNQTKSHWATTVYIATNVSIQFLILAAIAMLPSTPLPSEPPSEVTFLTANFARWDMFKLPTFTPISLTKALLPILHIPSLLIITFMRRGPPLHLPLDSIYPPKITDAIPQDHPSTNPQVSNVSEEVQCNIPEYLLFGYATSVIKKGYYAQTMDVWDLPVLTADMRAMSRYMQMRKTYGKQRYRLGKWEGYNLLWKIAQANSGPIIAQTILAALTAAGYYVPHYLLKLFIQYLENDPTRSTPAWGWLIAFALFVSNAIIYITSGQIWSISTTTLQGGIKMQLNTMLFAKTLVKKDIASSVGDEKSDDKGKEAGTEEKDTKEDDSDDDGVSSKTQIMTLFTVDVDRVTEFVFHEFALIDSPIEIVVATLFLLKLLGTSALFGLLASLLCMPLNHLASKVVVTAQENLMKTRDQRTALMNEILQGIRMLKFMAWERSFEKRIHSIRKNELHWQARNYQIEVAFNCIWALTPVLVTVISFLHYTLVRGQNLSPSIAFTSVAVFAELRYALNALPETFIQALQGFVSCKRIEKYMSLAEVPRVRPFGEPRDITMTNVTFTWPRDDSSTPVVDGVPVRSAAATPKNAFTLADLTLRFPAGKLSLICGRLGSGKSLLLNGLLGEADTLTGQLDTPRSAPDAMALFADSTVKDEDWIVNDMVAYVPQQAWLQNASIKDNIIFSSPWNEKRYQEVLEACSLTTDLEILEDGDQTEIGEKGLNLSGGQKARVSLARAVYSRAGTLLLDDVLSAVDAHTAHAIVEDCLNGPILAGRTILLVSHHTALVSPVASYIVALENGDVKFSGTREDFVECGLMKELDADENKPMESPIEELKQSDLQNPALKRVASLGGVKEASEPNSETSSIAPEDELTLAGSSDSDSDAKKAKAPRKLIEDEKRATGRIAWAVWRTYFTALGGKVWWPIFILSLVMSMVVPLAEKGWLQYWTGSHPKEDTHTTTYYVLGYALITMVGVVMSNLQYAVVYYGSLKSSVKLHNAMLENVLFATLRFHDTTSRGRLLNRFGKDIEGLDSSMADNLVRSLSYGLNVVVTFASITYVGGLPSLIAGGIVMIAYYQAGSIYGQTSRDMRRLDSITRSPLYSLFGETVSGVAVIRAFGGSTIALRNMLRLGDTNILAFVWNWTVNRWLSARFNVLSSFLVGLTAVAILIAPGVSAAMAGFALAFANTISHDLLFVVRRYVQLEQSMVALERIKEYSELTQEAAEFIEPRPPQDWPHQGSISVENLVIRYAPDLPNVLHGISFDVAAQEKVGIVGSTGCGKSTLALSFFRFVEAAGGRIVIDGLDIAKIGLTDLRSRVTIIPQDPTILSGTLRSTLDVFDEYNDADIYAALRRVHLLKDEDFVQPADDADESRNVNVFKDLNNPVSEGGDNFSSGQKQLICMARAILRRNKLLFMDEATASIDYETDELISKTIREEFSDSTILTIAHRIHTIIDFDKVLVMDQGRIAEYASPAELLRDHKSKFYSLCRATGRTEFKNLKTMAMEAERKRKEQVTK